MSIVSSTHRERDYTTCVKHIATFVSPISLDGNIPFFAFASILPAGTVRSSIRPRTRSKSPFADAHFPLSAFVFQLPAPPNIPPYQNRGLPSGHTRPVRRGSPECQRICIVIHDALTLPLHTLAFTWPPMLVSASIIVFLIICLLMIAVILLQRPQGGGLAGAFGGGQGAGQTAFGTKTGDALTWFTVGVFALFIVMAVVLNYATRPQAAAADIPAAASGAETPATTPATTPASTGTELPLPAATPAATPTTTPADSTPPATTPPAVTPPAATPPATTPSAPGTQPPAQNK
jgi:preprotein translocase subunit SecG